MRAPDEDGKPSPPVVGPGSAHWADDLLNYSLRVFLTSACRFNRLCLAKRLKLRNSGPPVLVNRLRIRLENVRTGMAHYLRHKEWRDARLCETTGECVPEVVDPEILKSCSFQGLRPDPTDISQMSFWLLWICKN